MNYRHAFHAGNFADLVKHAALLRLLERMRALPGPLAVVDTHAGRGLYDLQSDAALRSGEAEAGVLRLMRTAPPEPFAPLADAVARLNGGAGRPVRRYPGSPWLIAEALRPNDRFAAIELRPDEQAALAGALAGRPGVSVRCADGFAAAPAELPPSGAALVLIDPPFERPDDYDRIVETVRLVRRRNPEARLLIWTPLKDLETFDALLRDLEEADPGLPLLVSETRLRPLDDPMRMNGCALVLAGETADLSADLQAIAAWTAETLGDQGSARTWRP